MAELPTGTVTFLFTDIEGSTQLWERSPDQARAALVRHDQLIDALVAQHAGTLVRPRGEGDSRFAVFPRASDAVAAAAAIQRALQAEPWPTPTPVRVRMALTLAETQVVQGDLDACDHLLELAATKLREGRALIARPHTPRWSRKLVTSPEVPTRLRTIERRRLLCRADTQRPRPLSRWVVPVRGRDQEVFRWHCDRLRSWTRSTQRSIAMMSTP